MEVQKTEMIEYLKLSEKVESEYNGIEEDDNRVSNRTLDFGEKRSEVKFISGISKEFGMGYKKAKCID